jgi:hypothetical protein
VVWKCGSSEDETAPQHVGSAAWGDQGVMRNVMMITGGNWKVMG